MQALDTQGKFGEIFLDPNRRIPKAHLEKVCKRGKGTSACRYISLSIKGFVCTKNSALQKMVDDQVAAGNFGACGDNCEGFRSNAKKSRNPKKPQDKEDNTP